LRFRDPACEASFLTHDVDGLFAPSRALGYAFAVVGFLDSAYHLSREGSLSVYRASVFALFAVIVILTRFLLTRRVARYRNVFGLMLPFIALAAVYWLTAVAPAE